MAVEICSKGIINWIQMHEVTDRSIEKQSLVLRYQSCYRRTKRIATTLSICGKDGMGATSKRHVISTSLIL
jgi:hypothetical protein